MSENLPDISQYSFPLFGLAAGNPYKFTVRVLNIEKGGSSTVKLNLNRNEFNDTKSVNCVDNVTPAKCNETAPPFITGHSPTGILKS